MAPSYLTIIATPLLNEALSIGLLLPVLPTVLQKIRKIWPNFLIDTNKQGRPVSDKLGEVSWVKQEEDKNPTRKCGN